MTSTVVAAAVACLVVGAAVAACGEDTITAEQLSAEQILDNANATMKALTSLTIDAHTDTTAGGGVLSSHLTTDLKSRCASRTTWTTGEGLEQIRVGGTDYVRPNRAYLERWPGKDMSGTKQQNRWVKTPATHAQPGDGLAECPQEFAAFGTATKGAQTKVGGDRAIQLVVTDKADKGGTYTFYVATEGKPYILKVVYKGAEFHSTTSFSAFDRALNVRAPATSDVLDTSKIRR